MKEIRGNVTAFDVLAARKLQTELARDRSAATVNDYFGKLLNPALALAFEVGGLPRIRVGTSSRCAPEKPRISIRAAAPKAQECISYGLPAFRLDQKPLVAFGAATKHCALYLMSGSIVERHQDELKNYDISKGTIRFQPNKPLPTALVRKLVKARIAENRQPTQKQPTAQGVPTGYWEWFGKDGTRLRSGHFEKGERVGEWITYDKQGQKYKVTQINPKPGKA